jgi:hypothetical protein
VNDQETEKSAQYSKKWSKLPNWSKEEERKEPFVELWPLLQILNPVQSR